MLCYDIGKKKKSIHLHHLAQQQPALMRVIVLLTINHCSKATVHDLIVMEGHLEPHQHLSMAGLLTHDSRSRFLSRFRPALTHAVTGTNAISTVTESKWLTDI